MTARLLAALAEQAVPATAFDLPKQKDLEMESLVDAAFTAGWRAAHIYNQKINAEATTERDHEYLARVLAEFKQKLLRRDMRNPVRGTVKRIFQKAVEMI